MQYRQFSTKNEETILDQTFTTVEKKNPFAEGEIQQEWRKPSSFCAVISLCRLALTCRVFHYNAHAASRGVEVEYM